MSRLRSWIDTDDMEREDVAMLMTDEMVDIKLLRQNKLDDNDGFRKQGTGQYLELKRIIKGRIDRRNAIYRPKEGDAGIITDQLFIATVYYKNLLANDVLELDNRQYRVKFINKVGQGFTEAELEVLV